MAVVRGLSGREAVKCTRDCRRPARLWDPAPKAKRGRPDAAQPARCQAVEAVGRLKSSLSGEHPIAGDELRAIERYLAPSCGGHQHRFCFACALPNAHLSFGGFKLGCLNYSFCTETELYARSRCALKTQSDHKVPQRVAGQFTPFADLGSERHAFFSNAPFH